MPRNVRAGSFAIAVAVVSSGCVFDAKYDGGHYTCSDGKCPTGLVCTSAKVCAAVGDGGLPVDSSIDARMAALTCADPQPIVTGAVTGTTVGRVNTVSASCGGFVMNGPDAVYRFTATAGQQITISLDAVYPANAYVIAPCAVTPATPVCEGNQYATAGAPITRTLTAGPHFIVVDNGNPALTGSYTLTVN